MRILILAAAAMALTLMPARAEDTENARYLCALVDATGLASAQCETSVWNAAVVATIDMSSSEARDLCGKIAGFMAQKGRQFDRDWTFQIKSPYSGDSSIAFCSLPRR